MLITLTNNFLQTTPFYLLFSFITLYILHTDFLQLWVHFDIWDYFLCFSKDYDFFQQCTFSDHEDLLGIEPGRPSPVPDSEGGAPQCSPILADRLISLEIGRVPKYGIREHGIFLRIRILRASIVCHSSLIENWMNKWGISADCDSANNPKKKPCDTF